MINEKKALLGGINTDDSERLLEPTDYLNMENMRTGGSETGRNGRLENIPGTIACPITLPTGTNQVIGRCNDESKRRIFYFMYNSNGNHGIYCYDEPSSLNYKVLMSADVVGGLNFSDDYRIHSCFFVNDCVYWTDELNEPRKVNVERGIKAYQPSYVTEKKPYTLPVKQVHISWIRKPPILPPSWTKRQKTTSGNAVDLVSAKWYDLYFKSGLHRDIRYYGHILKVTTSRGDTYYGGVQRKISSKEYAIDLYFDSGGLVIGSWPGNVNPILPINIDFTTLPTATAFATIEEMMSFYADDPTHVDKYFHDIQIFQPNVSPAVTITSFPVPNSINPNNFIRYEAMQFCWRYLYWDYENSVLSRLSKTANYNFLEQQDDIVDITLPFDEYIEQDVLQVDLVVRYVPSDLFYVIKSWKNTPEANGADIIDHNNISKALSFSFDNSYIGTALDKAYCAKKYDSVPLKARTVELAKNRSYMGNNLMGYDTPSSTTLTANIITASDNTVVVGTWYYQIYNNGASKKYFLFVYPTWYSAPTDPPPFPPNINISSLRIAAHNSTELAAYLTNNPDFPNTVGTITSSYQTSIVDGITVPLVGLKNTRTLKSDSSYKLSLSFMDYASRECGVVTSESLMVYTKDRPFLQSSFEIGINWALTTNPSQIPVWATHYSVDITKCLRTRFFLQLRNTKACYVSKDTSGKSVYTNHSYAGNLKGCAFDMGVLLTNGMGYAYDGGSGDIVKIWIGTNQFLMKVTGTDGNWLITELQDLGVLDDTTLFLFEIYTPHKRTESEPYFEQAQVFKILNPGTINRAFSVSGGTIDGDVYLLQRNDGTTQYLSESMSPTDKIFNIWNTDAGKSNTVDTIGQVQLSDAISFSNKYTPDTRVNGLSSFDAIDTDVVFEEMGALQRLILANKQQEDGSVLMAICERGPVSLYLGETQLVSNTGNAFLAQAVGVIGTKNALKSSNGTMHPESAFEYLGEIYWLDMYNRCFVRYSNNGVYAISEEKLFRFFGKYCRKYLDDGKAVIKARNGFCHITCCVDPFNKELLVTLPATEDPNYAGNLPGYSSRPSYVSSIDNRYDFYDGKAKTIAYKFKSKRWVAAYGFVPDTMAYIGTNLYGWKSGNLHRHEADKTVYNRFYDQFYTPRVCFVSDDSPSDVRAMLTIAVEANSKPTFTHLCARYPYDQATDLVAADYKTLEGVHYAAFKNNMLTPVAGLTSAQKMIKGDRIRAANPWVMVEFDNVYNKLLVVDFLNVGYRKSAGHKV